MIFEGIHFPLYRKYKNNKSYFKIISKNEFEEIQVVGSKKVVFKISAKQLPEMNRIYDLVFDKSSTEELSAEEYEELRTNLL